MAGKILGIKCNIKPGEPSDNGNLWRKFVLPYAKENWRHHVIR